MAGRGPGWGVWSGRSETETWEPSLQTGWAGLPLSLLGSTLCCSPWHPVERGLLLRSSQGPDLMGRGHGPGQHIFCLCGAYTCSWAEGMWRCLRGLCASSSPGCPLASGGPGPPFCLPPPMTAVGSVKRPLLLPWKCLASLASTGQALLGKTGAPGLREGLGLVLQSQ